MRLPPILLLGLLLTGCGEARSPEPTDRYGFLALLGNDTISIESVTRYQDRFVSEEVDRFPEVKRRHTEVELAPDGSPRRMDMRVRIPSAEAASRDRRIVAEFDRDEVRVSLTDGTGTQTKEMDNEGMLTLPHVPQMYSLLELYFSAALERAAAESLPVGGKITAHQFYPDREFSNYPNPMHRGYVQPGPNGTVEIQHNWLAGTGSAVLDSNRRMLSYSGARTTYQVTVTRLAEPPDVEGIGVGFAATEQARGRPSRVSVHDTLRANIGNANVTVSYGRPLARGRALLGNVIPYNYVWRTGANEATLFSTSAPITLGGIELEPGTYSLWTLPRRDGVSLIVNRQIGQWGTGYGPGHDIGRTPLDMGAPTQPVEKFSISISPVNTRSGLLVLEWGPFRWTAPISLK